MSVITIGEVQTATHILEHVLPPVIVHALGPRLILVIIVLRMRIVTLGAHAPAVKVMDHPIVVYM